MWDEEMLQGYEGDVDKMRKMLDCSDLVEAKFGPGDFDTDKCDVEMDVVCDRACNFMKNIIMAAKRESKWEKVKYTIGPIRSMQKKCYYLLQGI